MAIILSDKYPGRSNPPSLDYPQGSIKDQSAPQAKDGTPLKADWANDHEGFFQRLLKEADITANGDVDTVVSSQYFDALKTVIASESPSPSQATETTAGVAKIATQAKVNAGTDDLDFVTSKKLRFGVSYSFGATSGYLFLPSWLGGLGLQWTKVTTAAGAAYQTFNHPTPFPNNGFFALTNQVYSGTNYGAAFVNEITKTSTTISQISTSSASTLTTIFSVGN